MSRPNFKHLNMEEFAYQFGDEIELESEGIRAVVLNFDKRDSMRVYGICFVKNGKLFGQLLPINKEGRCIDMLDFRYISEPLALQFKKVRSLEIDIKKVMIGGRYGCKDKAHLITTFNKDISKRKIKNVTCDENSGSVPFYFKIEKYLK